MTNHRTTRTRQSQVGRDRQTPQWASEVSSNDETPPLLCCLTRNQLPLQHVRCPLEANPRPPPVGDLKDRRSRHAHQTAKQQTRSKNVTTVAHPVETEHNLFVHRRRATAEPLTRPSTGVDNRQDLRATEATLHPCARLATLPTPKCWVGHCSDRSRKETRQKPSTATHSNESSTSSSLASPAATLQHRGVGGPHSA